MPIYCFVPECKSSGTNGLHRFPTDPDLRMKWIEKVRANPTKYSKVCRNHFKESDLVIDVDGKKRLASKAVPCLFLPAPFSPSMDHCYNSVCTHLSFIL